MQTTLFTEKIWEANNQRIYSARMTGMLHAKNTLVILKNGRPPYQVVLGVPHQARIGEAVIAEEWTNPRGGRGRDSDENAASFALIAFSRLCDLDIPCKLVIAAHASDHDPNKDINSPYCREVFSEEMNLLFECHGAGARRFQELELSGGTNALGNPLNFGRALAEKLNYQYSLSAQTNAGTFSAKSIHRQEEADTNLALPALATSSLSHAQQHGTPALHLEAKPRFRISTDTHSVTEDGFTLGNAIADVIFLQGSASSPRPSAPASSPTTSTPTPQPETPPARRNAERSSTTTARPEPEYEFWRTLLEKARTRTTLHSNVSPGTNSYIYTGAGRTGLGYSYLLRTNDAQVGLYLDHQQKEWNKRAFMALEQHKAEIENRFGGQLDWQFLPEKRASRIRYVVSGVGGLHDRECWDELQNLLIDAMIRLEYALRPYLNELAN